MVRVRKRSVRRGGAPSVIRLRADHNTQLTKVSQEANDVLVSFRGRVMQAVFSEAVCCVQVGRVLREGPGDFNVTKVAREHQRRLAHRPVRLVHRVIGGGR